MKHVFIIPEPHIWDKSFKNRVDYPAEIYGYLEEIVGTIQAYSGDKIIIFPGDIFHRSYTSVGSLIKAFNFFADLYRLTNGNLYSCVGNHEITYCQMNPFWMLCDDQTNLFENMHNLEAFGTMHEGIKIVNDLIVGNLQFKFGHYGTVPEIVNSDRDIVYISHNSIIEPEIANYLQNDLGRAVNSEYMQTTALRSANAIPIGSNLKFVFVGHMHTFHSSFTVDEVIEGIPMRFELQYLGSLGRTAINEVNNSDLGRTIPHFEIADDGSYEYKPFKMNLLPREDIVKEQVVAASAEKYQAQKAVTRLKDSNVFGTTAEQAITRALSEYPANLQIFSEFYYNQPNADILNLIREASTL